MRTLIVCGVEHIYGRCGRGEFLFLSRAFFQCSVSDMAYSLSRFSFRFRTLFSYKLKVYISENLLTDKY